MPAEAKSFEFWKAGLRWMSLAFVCLAMRYEYAGDTAVAGLSMIRAIWCLLAASTFNRAEP